MQFALVVHMFIELESLKLDYYGKRQNASETLNIKFQEIETGNVLAIDKIFLVINDEDDMKSFMLRSQYL